jgi:hypothetical protein
MTTNIAVNNFGRMKDYLRENIFPATSDSLEYLNLILEHVPLNNCDVYIKDAYPLT